MCRVDVTKLISMFVLFVPVFVTSISSSLYSRAKRRKKIFFLNSAFCTDDVDSYFILIKYKRVLWNIYYMFCWNKGVFSSVWLQYIDMRQNGEPWLLYKNHISSAILVSNIINSVLMSARQYSSGSSLPASILKISILSVKRNRSS